MTRKPLKKQPSTITSIAVTVVFVFSGKKTIFESEEVERLLGWRIFRPSPGEVAKIVSCNELREIAHLRDNSYMYLLKAIPPISPEEAGLLVSVIGEYRDSVERGGSFDVRSTLDGYCASKLLELGQAQENYLRRALESMISKAGMLTEFLGDDSLEEIAVIGTGKSRPVYVFDESFGWMRTNLYFSSNEELRNIINAVGSQVGRRVTLRNPGLNAVLHDGSRINACVEPAAVSGPNITIRRSRKRQHTPCSLAAVGSASLDQMAFLWMAMQADCSVLVCGNTGSGKTTLLSTLFSFVPGQERVVIVEETPEITVPHRHTVRLGTAEGIEIGMRELITSTLRMRPDRVVVGEVRNREELGAFIDTLLAGQGKGSYATFHAQSAREAVARMKNLGAMEMDLLALDLIITQKRWSTYSNGSAHEERRLTELCETVENGTRVCARKLFEYDFRAKQFRRTGSGERINEKICRAFRISENGLWEELEQRKLFLSSLHGIGREEFFDAIGHYGKSC